MIAPKWWYDLRQYRRHLQSYTDEELVDVYFHIHPLQYQEHYLCVLAELRRRGIRPEIAERPLPDWAWQMTNWLHRWAWLRRSPLRMQIALALTTLMLSALLTSMGVGAVVVLMMLMGLYGPLMALGHLVLIGVAGLFGVVATWRAGAHGWLFSLALLGSATILGMFTQSTLFERLWEALLTPSVSVPWALPSWY